MTIKSLNIFLVLFSISFLNAQQNFNELWNIDIIFDHYSAAQGFSASQALCIEKAKDGFVWIGTEQGLVRYDGHVFKTYRSNPFDSTTISSNYIRNMVEDKHGRLWLTALPDLNIFDPKTNKCERISIPKDIDNQKKLDIRTMVYDERNDVMWLGTNKGLLYSQGKEVSLRKETIPEKDIASGIYDLELDGNGAFWIAANDGLWMYDSGECIVKNFHRPGHDSKVRFDDGFTSLYLNGNESTLWIGSWVNGLMKFDILSETMFNYTFADKTKIQNGIITIHQSGIRGEESILWLGTTDGVKTFETNSKAFRSYKSTNHDDIKGVPGAGFCFEPTASEGMWIGTFRGLHRYDPFKQNIKTEEVLLEFSQPNWVLEDLCFEAGGRKDSIIWFGVGYESFFRYDIIRNIELKTPLVLKPFCTKVDPLTLFIDSENILWLSSIKRGLIGYDMTIGKLITPNLNIKTKENPRILKIIEDADRNLWLGSTGGMYKYDRKRNEIKDDTDIRKFLNDHKLSDYVFKFTIDSLGKLWIISAHKYEEEDALYYFDPILKDSKLFTQDQFPALKILKNLESIESISQNSMMITSLNGFCLVKTDTAIPTFELFETYNEKPLGAYKSIVKDLSGNVWMSSDIGVSKFDPKTNTVSRFTYFNSNIGLTSRPEIFFSKLTNSVWLSQNMAFNIIDIDDLKVARPGKLTLSDMKIINHSMDSMPNSAQRLKLEYDQNSIDLYFSNLNFTNSQENIYKYKLLGNISQWIPMSQNHLKFDNLGYGNYVLRVKAVNCFGLESNNDFILYLDIAPPYWRTWWFNGLILALISLVIYIFFKYKDLQRQKLENLRHNIARDLHDDMGSTLSHIKMMSERESMRKEFNPTFKIIADKTSEVMSNMSEIIWSINPKNDSLKNIVGKIQEFAIDTLEPLGIEILFDIDDVPDHIKFNPENRRHFYLIFKEAINNTAKYSKASEVLFAFKNEKGKMLAKFVDNGLGFDPLLISKGNGLKNMASRAKNLKCEFRISTNNRGTSVILVLTR